LSLPEATIIALTPSNSTNAASLRGLLASLGSKLSFASSKVYRSGQKKLEVSKVQFQYVQNQIGNSIRTDFSPFFCGVITRTVSPLS